jgi:MFS family permease
MSDCATSGAQEAHVSSTSPSLFERVPPLRALRHRGFRLLTISTAPHLLAMQMSTVALGYLAYALSGSATALGFIGLGWGIPMLVLSLVGGVVADRFPRKLILMGTQSLVGLSALLGAVLLLANVIQIWHIFVIALMQGTAFAFNMPARQALIGELVSPEEIGTAVALNNTLMNASRVIGPPIAGFLIGAPTVGVNGVYVLMAGAYLVVLALLARLPRTAGPGRPSSGGWRSLLDGLGFIRQSPALLVLLVLAFVPMFLGMPYQMLMPVFAVGILQAGPEGLGLLNAANGLGAVAGSVVVAFLASGGGQRRAQVVLGILFGLGLAAFAYSPSLWLAALALALVGAA